MIRKVNSLRRVVFIEHCRISSFQCILHNDLPLIDLAMEYRIKLLQLCLVFACLHMAVLSSHVRGLGVFDMRWDVFFQY